MTRLSSVAVLLLVCLSSFCYAVPVHRMLEGVQDEYIVVFKKHAHTTDIQQHMTLARTLLTGRPDSPQLSRSASGRQHGILAEYDTALKGFTARMSEEHLKHISEWDAVDYIEQNAIARADFTQSNPGSWGLDRIDQVSRNLDKVYSTNLTGCGVNVYVVDTGIAFDLPDFEGRAQVFGDYSSPYSSPLGYDCHGHGTHTAGTVGSKTYGVAKRANIWAVRVLSCLGSGFNSDILTALNDIAVRHVKPAVVSMSLGSIKSDALNAATAALVAAGIPVTVSAGNDAGDACDQSPASEPSAITVAATDMNDRTASYSNIGPCVDIFAPGSSIKSWWGKKVAAKSGTSMAAPHVAGVAALLLEKLPGATPLQVKAAIVAAALVDAVLKPAIETPNLLLHIITTHDTDLYSTSSTAQCGYAAPPCGPDQVAIWGECRSSASAAPNAIAGASTASSESRHRLRASSR